MRQISPRYLSQDERIEIADLRRARLSIGQIADKIGRAPSTVSRELRRNSRRDGTYRPFEAHRWAVMRRARRHPRRVETNPELGEAVAELLAQRWSPPQIARHLRRRFPDDRSMWLCHESIYQAVYQSGSLIVRPLKIVSLQRGPLRTGRDHRKAHQRPSRRRPRFAQPMLSIHQRPFEPSDRSQTGHWEGDLIVGKNQGSVIGTLVERQTRLIRLLHLPNRDADSLRTAITAAVADLPVSLVRSITWDQGIEMARHIVFRKKSAPVETAVKVPLTGSLFLLLAGSAPSAVVELPSIPTPANPLNPKIWSYERFSSMSTKTRSIFGFVSRRPPNNLEMALMRARTIHRSQSQAAQTIVNTHEKMTQTALTIQANALHTTLATQYHAWHTTLATQYEALHTTLATQ